MPDSKDIWSPLASAEIPQEKKVLSLIKAKSYRAQQKKMEESLWEGIDNGNEEMVISALKGGARVECKRRNITPIFEAFNKNHPNIAKILIEHGADINVQNASRRNLQHPVFEHDSVELAEILVSNGFDITKQSKKSSYPPSFHLTFKPKLLHWWVIEKKFPLKFEDADVHSKNLNTTLPTWVESWTWNALMNWKSELFESIVQKIKEENSDKNLFQSPVWKEKVKGYWLTAFKKDNAEMIRFMVKKNWTPELVCYSSPGYYNSLTKSFEKTQRLSIFWMAVQQKALSCMELLLKSPAIQSQVHFEIENHSDILISQGIIDLNISLLEKLKDLGFDWHKQGSEGTLLHYQKYSLTQTFVDWAARKDPDFLFAKNKAGKTVFEENKELYVLQSLAEKIVLKKEIGRAPRKKKENKVIKKRL